MSQKHAAQAAGLGTMDIALHLGIPCVSMPPIPITYPISTPEQAKKMAEIVDGVIVGWGLEKN